MRDIIAFKNEDEFQLAMTELAKDGYTFSNGYSLKSEFANKLYSEGLFLLIDSIKGKISYYNNFYQMPRFAAEEIMRDAISVNDLIAVA